MIYNREIVWEVFGYEGLNSVLGFRHRCGYGVHSPSDFFLITFVIYEQAPYYAFASLHHLRRVVSHLPHYREKVDRFLFRLANYLQPVNIVEAGTGKWFDYPLYCRSLSEIRCPNHLRYA